MAHITLLAHGLPGRGPGHQRRHITISIAIPMGGQGRLPPTHHPAPPCPNKWGWGGDNFCSNLVMHCSLLVLNICGVKKSVWGPRQMWLVGGGSIEIPADQFAIIQTKM